MKEICVGCGSVIQTTDPKTPGYIKPQVYAAHRDDFYCERCFILQHYNKNVSLDYEANAFDEAMKEVKQGRGLVVFILSLFDLEGTIIPNLGSYVGNKEVLVVVNKFDLMMHSVQKNKLVNTLKFTLKQAGVKFVDLILMSSFYSEDIEVLVEKMNEYRQGKNVYFVGTTNVGKSTIVNQLIHHYTKEEPIITVSNTVNTTLGNIHIPLDEKSDLVDTPGRMNEASLIHYLSKEHLDAITPSRFICPKTFQLSPLQTVFIQGIVRIDFLEGEKSSLITYFKNESLIHRTKLEAADAFYEKHADDLLIIPDVHERQALGPMIHLDYTIDSGEKKDLSIQGLGFVTITGKMKIRVHTFQKVRVGLREALI